MENYFALPTFKRERQHIVLVNGSVTKPQQAAALRQMKGSWGGGVLCITIRSVVTARQAVATGGDN